MANKTDRILSYLPSTFRPAPQQSPLYALIDAFGNELLGAENSLAAIRQSHWVDRADRGAELIDDLQRLTSLYGLAPRPDESVEEFREHLKRYIRTFLEGTVTVQGILRVTAEVLGLPLADAYSDMDTWWTRDSDALLIRSPRRDNAAELLLGVRSLTVRGRAAQPAQVIGTVDLTNGVDLRDTPILSLEIDSNVITIDFNSTGLTLENLSLEALVTVINQVCQPIIGDIAAANQNFLQLTAPSIGEDSFLEVLTVDNDAAGKLLGLVPRNYRGTVGMPAQMISQRDLSQGANLSDRSSLQIRLDGGPSVTIDCRGIDPGNTRPGEIVAKINNAFGFTLARQFDRFLQLTSSSTGTTAQLTIETPTTGDATAEILGIKSRRFTGKAATVAEIIGIKDLSSTVNLMARRFLHLSVDGSSPVTIEFDSTSEANLTDLVTKINLGRPEPIALDDGQHLILRSPSRGATSQIAVLSPSQEQLQRFITRAFIANEANQAIFGFLRRSVAGIAPTVAQVVGKIDLSRGIDLRQKSYLRLSIDGRDGIEINCAGKRPRATLSSEVVSAINRTLGTAWGEEHLAIASLRQPGYLVLTAAATGQDSRIVFQSPQTPGAEDAREILFGEVAEITSGERATAATIVGEVDLLRSVDLSQNSLIRLAVDDNEPVEINVAGVAPQTTFLEEIITAINAVYPGMASATESDRLQITSPTGGENSRIEILPLRSLDLIEYPPQLKSEPLRLVIHGEQWSLNNCGIAEVFTEIDIDAPQGVVGPTLVNLRLGWQLRLLKTLKVGEKAHIERDTGGGIRVTITHANGQSSVVENEDIFVGPLDAPAENLAKETVLSLPPGKTQWLYQDCYSSRFNQGKLNDARFAGGQCSDRGIFNVSRFTSRSLPSAIAAVFAPSPLGVITPVAISFRWLSYEPGAFQVNLPLDLPPRFGARFNQAYFSQGNSKAELYEKTVTEPEDDPDYLPTQINANAASLVIATKVGRVPLGWQAVQMPFRKPQFLRLGSENAAAKIYLTEKDIDGFIELQAKQTGNWGNEIAVSVRPSGPALYDVSITYTGARFENARQLVLGATVPALTKELLQPSPVGISQAKAAGIRATVSRDFHYIYGNK